MAASSNQVIIEHASLLNKMHFARYKVNPYGECHGVAYAGGRAFVIDVPSDNKNKNLKKFFNRLSNINEKDDLYFTQLRRALSGESEAFNAEKIDILAFFDSVALLQSPDQYREIFINNQASQINIPAAPYVLDDTTINNLQLEKSELNKYYTSALPREELSSHIELLASKIKVRTSIKLSSHNHAICICFDPDSENNDKPWHLIDANYLIDSTYSSSEISEMLPKSLMMDEKDDLFFFSSHYFCSNINQEQLKQNVKSIIDSAVYKSSHEVTPVKAVSTSKDNVTWLYTASINGDKVIVKQLLENNAAINQAIDGGSTPLLIATQNGHKEIVEILLAKGANVHLTKKSGASALFMAAENGHAEIIKILKAKGANVDATLKDGTSPLYQASALGQLQAVDTLIKAGADLELFDQDGICPLYVAVHHGHKDIVELLLKAGANTKKERRVINYTPLHIAIGIGDIDLVKLLVEFKDDIDLITVEGQKALCLAATYNRKEIMEILLEKGAKVNQIGKNDETPLYNAALRGHKETVSILLERGADVNQECSGKSPLWVASSNGCTDVVEILLKQGANVNQDNSNGLTPLVVAAKWGHIETVKTLIAAKANIDKVTSDGTTALYVALKGGHHEFIELLLSAGASTNFAGNEQLSKTLHKAIVDENLTAIQLLIKYGANLEEFCLVIDSILLLLAATCGDKEQAELSLSKNANVNLVLTDNLTLLHFAIKNIHNDIVKLLLEYGANSEVKYKDQYTALYFAVEVGNFEAVELLISHGANISHKTESGDTLVNVAQRMGHSKIVDILEKSHNEQLEQDKASKINKSSAALPSTGLFGHSVKAKEVAPKVNNLSDASNYDKPSQNSLAKP